MYIFLHEQEFLFGFSNKTLNLTFPITHVRTGPFLGEKGQRWIVKKGRKWKMKVLCFATQNKME